MEWNWARLGAALKAERTALRPRVTQLKMADRIGVSLATVQAIEGGKEFDKVTPTVRAYARELGWADGSVEKVLEGGEPVIELVPDDVPSIGRADDVSERSLESLPPAVRDALTRDGEVIDSTVLDVEVPGISGQMIIVVKGKPVAPPAVIARDLRDIAVQYLKLRGITPPDTEDGDAAAQA